MWFDITFRALMLVAMLLIAGVSLTRGDILNAVFAGVIGAGFAFLLINRIVRGR